MYKVTRDIAIKIETKIKNKLTTKRESMATMIKTGNIDRSL